MSNVEKISIALPPDMVFVLKAASMQVQVK
jgi:hypothetical protein